ncbi:DMT family transporter [Aestuariirhabdus litorea]|uniref:DMT family transporter n=1 Tax=Aestuariirhabdus litorea TaxID=2528527 RepID=A0A3P3VNK8_9GAMM|nr:DMT family transporter [Aestuariirhabdus litorea]RRJ83226.1 DMT family transporter [Aestuariirhabdus litorea]RWW93383.1 DMT family transporter [Endozoicomonadaceae bacterium GTF-13]
MSPQTRSVLFALITIVLWSSLAVLASFLVHIPAFLQLGVALTSCGLVSLFTWRHWRVPLRTLAVGIGGIFGYHYLLFMAYRHAPMIEATLINYLWPLLIVVLTPLYFREKPLRSYHLIGALLGISGAVLIISGGKLELNSQYLAGYLLAIGAAFAWSNYSLACSKLRAFPSAAIGGFCLWSGLLALSLYATEQWLAPKAVVLSLNDWLLMIAIGAGPLGAAFFTWDIALKNGDTRVVGALAYLAPMGSTGLLILFTDSPVRSTTLIAMLMIIASAVIGSWELLVRRPSARAGHQGGAPATTPPEQRYKQCQPAQVEQQ